MLASRANQDTTPAESPKTACARRRGSSWVPTSKRRALLNAAGIRKAPALSPSVLTGCRALGSRANENDEVRDARGEIHGATRGVTLTKDCNVRWVSMPLRGP